MDKSGGENIKPQREMSAQMSVEVIKDASTIQEIIGGLGHNRLNEHGFLEDSPSERGKWLEHVQSEVIDAHGAAVAAKEGDKIVGFVLADHEGVITQFRCAEGKEASALEAAIATLREKGFEHPAVRLTEKSEGMRRILLAAGFREEEKTEDGKILMRKG